MSASMERNKVAGAILTAGVIAMTGGAVARFAVHAPELEQSVYSVAPQEATAGAADAAGPSLEPVLPMLAEADIDAGKKVAKKCTACHTFEDGGANKIGPNLWGSVNRAIASVGGFGYSEVLAGMSGDAWTYQSLNAFLAKPKEFAPGTKMTFAGLKKVADRANLIAYMRSMAGSPAPMPTQEEIDAAMGGGDAGEEGEAPAEEADNSDATPEATEESEAPAEPEDPDAASQSEAPAEPEDPAASEQSEAPDDPDAPAESEAAESPDEPDSPDATQQAAAAGGPIGALLAAADPAAGKAVAKKCVVCHTFDKDGKKKIGPNLYNMVGAAIAGVEGFKYGKGLVAKSSETWSYENLDAWLAKPKDFASPTKMAFAGLKDAGDRAAIIAYMRQQTDDPPPLP